MSFEGVKHYYLKSNSNNKLAESMIAEQLNMLGGFFGVFIGLCSHIC